MIHQTPKIWPKIVEHHSGYTYRLNQNGKAEILLPVNGRLVVCSGTETKILEVIDMLVLAEQVGISPIELGLDPKFAEKVLAQENN